MSILQTLSKENNYQRTIHTMPYLRNQWVVKINDEIDHLKIFQNKCEAIDYGREKSIDNQAEHWIYHSDGSVMEKETYSQCHKLLTLVE